MLNSHQTVSISFDKRASHTRVQRSEKRSLPAHQLWYKNQNKKKENKKINFFNIFIYSNFKQIIQKKIFLTE